MQEDPEKKQLNLYSETILEESRAPYHFGKMPEGRVVVNAYNPYCGDKYQLFLETENGRVRSAYFHGYGCAVSKASCSVLVREVEGRTLEEAQTIAEEFLEAFREENPVSGAAPAFAAAFLPARDFPGRAACATLGWEALLEWMKA